MNKLEKFIEILKEDIKYQKNVIKKGTYSDKVYTRGKVKVVTYEHKKMIEQSIASLEYYLQKAQLLNILELDE